MPTGIVGPGGMANAESYTYDPDGERLTRTHGSTKTAYLGMWEEDLSGPSPKRRLQYKFGGAVVV